MLMQRLLLTLLLFVSGLCGVSYEILYGRMLGNVIGDQFLVSTAVLLTFLLGIGVGALHAHRLWRQLWLVEAGIGLYAVVFTLQLPAIELWLYAALPGVGTSVSASLAVAVLLLVTPAFLIGVSLPLFAGYAHRLRPREGYFAATYAVYNFGAAATVIFIEFWLIREAGIRQAVLTMGAFNGAVALVLLAAYRPSAKDAPAPPVRGRFQTPLLFALVLAGIGSAVFQLTAVRLSEMLFGPYRESFAYVLCIILLGIALGSLLVRWLRLNFLVLMAANLVALAWMLGGLEWVMVRYAATYPELGGEYWPQVGLKFLSLAALALAPATLFGATIPALLNTADGPDTDRGAARSPGYLLYVASLANAGGFLLMSLLLHQRLDYGDLLLVVGLFCAASLVAAGWFRMPDETPFWQARLVPAALLATLLGLLTGGRLLWNEEMLYQGHMAFKSPQLMERRIGGHATSERYKGAQDVLSISRRGGSSYFFINGKISIRLEDVAEKLVGAIGGVYSPALDRAMVLGVGSGATAGTVGLMFDKVDAVEISEVILENLPRLAQHNFDIVDMDNVNLLHDDGLHAVKLAEPGYSLILNTVTSPLFFSSSKLYTVDFLADVRAKLAPGGLYVTWLDGRVGDAGGDIMLASVTSAFEHCGVAQIGPTYLLLLCSDQPIVAHQPLAVARSERLARYFREEHDIDPADIAYQLVSTDASLANNPEGAVLNTLDYPALEFEMARLARRSMASMTQRLVLNLDTIALGEAFREFDWGLAPMLRALDKSTGDTPFVEALRDRQARFRELYDSGLQAQAQGDCRRAAIQVGRALALEGKRPDRQLQVARCHEMREEFAEALARYEQALANRPGDTALPLVIARVLLWQGDGAAALARLDTVSAGQRGAVFHYLYGTALEAGGDEDAALSHFERAVDLAGSRSAAAEQALALSGQ